jgi:hypothetical protein
MVLPFLPPATRQLGYYRPHLLPTAHHRLTLLHQRIFMEHHRSLFRRSIRPTEHRTLPLAPDRSPWPRQQTAAEGAARLC